MAEFNRFRGGGLGSLYPGFSNLPQGNMNRLEDRFDDRRNSRGGGGMSGFDRRDDRDFGRLPRDPSPRRRRYSPDPPYSSMRGNRRDDRLDYPMEPLGDSFSSRGQRINESEFSRAGRSLGPPNRGDGILGAKPGDIPQSSRSNTGGLTSQLAQQQQQIMAMVQTQSLLAAIQAQASAAAKRGGIGPQPPSLMQGIRMHDNRGRMDNRQNRKRRMSPIRQGNQRNRNQQGYRQQRSQNQRSGWQNLDRERNQRRDRDRSRMSESSKKSEENEPIEEPYVEENPDEEEEVVEESQKEENKETEAPKVEEPKEKIEEPKKEQPTEKVESKTKSEEPSVNLAGQNVDHLCKSLWDKHRGKWVCKVCKIMCNKVVSFRQHLFGRRHVKTWLENQGRSFEAEIFRKATEEAAKTVAKEQPKLVKEEKKEETQETSKEEKEVPLTKTEESAESKQEEQPVETPAAEVKVEEESVEATAEPIPSSENVETKPAPMEVKEEKKEQVLDVKYSCDTRKTAVKEGEYITISSVNEARVRINGFDTGINTEGCEFVKAVSGFQCRLCKMFIARGHDVMKHVRGRKHQSNYRQYIHQHPKYEANQKMRNQELAKMLSEREGDTFLLYEVSDEEEETRQPSHHRSDNVRVTKYVVANEEEEGHASMEDKSSDPIENKTEPEPSQENSPDQEKTFEEDGGGLYDPEDVYEGEKDESNLNEDIGLDSEDLPKEDDNQELEENINDAVDISLDANASTDFASESLGEEEPLEKKTKVTASAKRGRKTARGGAQGGRGRGRNRGGRRTRQSPKAAAAKAKLNSDENEMHNEDVDFMDGFEVIDEIADDEM